jgi:transposase
LTKFFWVPAYKDKIFLHEKYVILGLSISQIAAEIFSSRATVRDWLIEFGIAIRKPHQPHGRPSQPKYGTRKVKGQVIPHLAERRVIETVRDLSGQGLSLRAIVKVLQKMEVPTKHRGKKWHPEMVRRILEGKSTDACGRLQPADEALTTNW